jgi:hypothetical protein
LPPKIQLLKKFWKELGEVRLSEGNPPARFEPVREFFPFLNVELIIIRVFGDSRTPGIIYGTQVKGGPSVFSIVLLFERHAS